MTRTRRQRVLAVVSLLAIAASGCDLRPRRPRLRYRLNDEVIAENEALASNAAAQTKLRGVLDYLFGTPQNPSYLVLPAWADEEFDPNFASYYGLTDEEFDHLKEGNREAYADQIAAIERGELEAVEQPRYAPDLWRRWGDFLASFEAAREEDPGLGLDSPWDPEDPEFGTWRDEAVAVFAGYYPELRASAEFYRLQCYHCHGSEGGGDGSTSDFLKPRPRDYRPGIFKYIALNNKARPRHADLVNVLREGVYMTAMPSFRRFSPAQLHGLADYVQLLSIRGETEILLATDFETEEGFSPDLVEETYAFVVDRWRSAGDELIVLDDEIPESTPERIAHGRELFLDEKGGNCIKCHGAAGRGDGPSAKERNPDTGEMEYAKDDWGQPIEPRDLTQGVFRFGRRPIDIYRRIYAGINGTPMPAHYGMQITEPDGDQRPMDEDDIWDLVFYVRSLSSHPMGAVAQADSGHGDDGDHGGH